jgi:hypothetical protein
VRLSEKGPSPAHKSCIDGAVGMHEFILRRRLSTERLFDVEN